MDPPGAAPSPRSPRAPRLALAHVLGGALVALVALGGTLAALVHRSSRDAVVGAAERLCATASREIASRVESRLRGADEAIDEFAREVGSGRVDPGDPAAVGTALVGLAVRRPDVAEAALTWDRTAGDADAHAAPGGRGQVAVERGRDDDALTVRTTLARGDAFESLATDPLGRPLALPRVAPDPTSHATFSTPASAAFRGRTLWSDLHRTQLDAALPAAGRRVVVAAQRRIDGTDPSLVAVLRVSLAPRRLDSVADLRLGDRDAADGLRVFLCDRRGRLVAPAREAGARDETDDGLRVPAADVDPDVACALAFADIRAVPADGRPRVTSFAAAGRPHLAAFRALPWSQDWLVGVVVAEEAFTSELEADRRRVVGIALGATGAALAAGIATIRAAGRAVRGVVAATDRMRAFDFAPSPRRSPVREVQTVLDGLEQAKASLRALGKFVPVDLVRRIHAAEGDPVPGGEMREATVLFTDLEGFTGLAETMGPDALARLMAHYFGAMTRAIHESRGTVDKFIGDSVMALWNAPEEVPGHAALACAAALACREAERRLLASDAWAGRPPVRTRIGLHTDVVLVGNLGAPDRLNYTALGDGVNLASRLEGLNRHYGTGVLASGAVVAAAGPGFAFRRIDRVAVKGRAGGVEVFALLGPAGTRTATDDSYERALDLLHAREFAAARDAFRACGDDPPARVLAARCESYLRDPPPPGWDGTFVHASK